MDEKLKKELKRLEKGKQKARQANDRSEEASLCNIAGELLAQHRRFEDAIEEHRAELHLSESLHDTIAVAVAHRKIGECLCELQDFEQALVHQQKHLELSRKCQNIVEEQRALATIGRTLFQSAGSTSEFLKAQTAFLESLSVCDQLRDIVKEKELLEMRARLYLNLGLVYNQLKNQKKGMKYIERALTITVNLDLKDTEYRCHFSLGEIKLADNHPAEALQSFERARKVAQHQKMTFEEADTLVQMGQALLQLGDFNGAKNILKKCFKTMKHGNMVEELRSSFVKSIRGTRLLEKLENDLETNDEILMKIYEDLGDLYSSVKCFSKAVHYYVKQLELSEVLGKTRKEKAVICYSIAQSYSDLKQYKKAKEYFWKELVLQKGEPQEQCVTWCKIAEVAELAGGSFEEIEKAYNNALKHVRKYKNPTKERYLLKLLSESRQKHKLDDDYALDEISTDPKIEEDLSEEQSLEHDDLDNDEDERLIQEEMEMSDSDDEHKEMNTSSTVRLKGKSKSIYKRNEKGETVLHVAAINGNYQLAKSSIEKGVSVHERDYCGWQPLHEACNHGNLSIVELLLDKGADINDPGGPHCRGMTPLHDAAQNGHVEVVKLLLAREASVSRSNKDGHTPLDLVMHSIDDDDDDDDDDVDDDDDLDVEVAKVREELARILRNAMKPGKRQSDKDSELRRRDKIELSDDSDPELSQDFSKVTSIKPGEISRKRKNVVLESDEENTPRNSMNFNGNKSKVAKVSENIDSDSLLDDDSQDRYDRKILESQGTARYSETRLVEDSDESSRDSVGDQGILRGKSQDSEDVIRLDSDPKNNQWSPFPELDIDPEHPSFSLEPSHTNTSISKPVLGNTTSRTSESLSRKNKNTSSITYVDPVTGNTQNDSRISESQPALIPENEYILTTTDDWLINDIPKTTGKRKRSGNILSMLCDSESSCNTSSSSRVRTNSNVSPTGTQSTRVVETSRGHRTNNGAKNRLRQSRLTVVNGRSSPSEPEPVTTSSLVSGATAIPEAPMRLRVKVEDKIFLIPCPIVPGERKTVRWLAEQAVFRYHSATGLKPILSLCTTEGASLSTDDLISEVLSSNEQVNAIVESWDLPPIHERYKVSCLMANTEVEMKILDVFERHPRISNVEFCNMSLTPAKLLPLFRSLQCHNELVKLALPGNRVGDIGLQHLASSLPCLANLSVLNLGCNGITHKGLRNLASSLSQDEKVSKAWSNLKELDISFNTINDTGGSSLATILRSCPDLLKLNIERCSLTQNAFHQRSTLIEAIKDLKRLQYLNISHNLIHAECLPSLLAACTSVEILNLSSTVNSRDPAFTSVLADHLKVENCCIQSLICRCCYLNDRDASVLARVMNVSTSCCRILDLGENNISDEGVSKLIESVQCNPNVTGLIFSGNLQVTTESFSKFFTSPSNLIHLDLSHCRIRSPLPECLLNQTTFPRQLVHLNLSFNLLDGQDISSLGRLWNLKWEEKCIMAVTKSIVLFDARKDSSSM